MTDRLSPQREAEIAEHLAATTNWSIGNLAARDLLAELAAVRAERDEARGDAELQRADYFSEAARLLEDSGRDDDAVNLLDNVAAGIRTHAETPNDLRRRIYIDGNGHAWIDQCIDESGAIHAVPIVDAAMEGRPLALIRETTGSLREIGRCW
jgi:hypothetical protein